MTFGLRVVAQALLMLTSIGVYGALGALHAPGGILTSIVLVALLAFVAILAHELAHAVAAHLVGARVHAIVAFPVRLRLRPRRMELIKRGAHHGGDLGGYVSYTLDRIDARRKHAIIAAAGPLANLALALLAATIERVFHHDNIPGGTLTETRAPALSILLSAFALLSGGLGLANLVPYRGSDGDHIANLWRRPARTWR